MGYEEELAMLSEVDDGPDATEVESLLKGMLEEAISWRGENLDPAQTEATEYYRGDPLGNEVEGRSQVVLTTVRDTVRGIIPSLVRVFFGSEHPVEFRPEGPEDTELAKQQTDYIRDVVVRQDNSGFLTFLSWFQDALIRKLGVVKWWWETKETVTGESYTGLTEEELGLITSEPGAEGVDVQQNGELPSADGMSPPIPLYDVTLRRVRRSRRARFQAVPPEEFVWSPDARSLDEADLVAHVRDMPSSDLAAMGVDPELLAEERGTRRVTDEGSLPGVRRLDGGAGTMGGEKDESRELVEYAEIYAYIDLDDDDIAELRLFKCVGASRKIINGDGLGEIVATRPFALLCPDPEAHALLGGSIADLTKDLQKINSMVMRGILDSLAGHLHPGMEVVEGEVNLQDAMNQELGRLIRARKPGMIREITTEFVGASALPVLEYMDIVKEARTGQSRASMGLDADALQSTTEVAVQATVQGAQQHIELIARIFAETGVKALYKGLLRLVVENQDEQRTVRLRNQWVPVDPRGWNADMDLFVNVSLGNTLVQQRAQVLTMILQKQEQYLTSHVPFVSFVELRNTLADLTELLGRSDVNRYFKQWGAQEQQAFDQQQSQQPPPPDPAVQKAQIQAQSDFEIAKLHVAAKEKEIAARVLANQDKDARERLRLEREADTQDARLEMELHHKASQTEIDAHMRAHEAEIEDARQRDIAETEIAASTVQQLAQAQATAKGASQQESAE